MKRILLLAAAVILGMSGCGKNTVSMGSPAAVSSSFQSPDAATSGEEKIWSEQDLTVLFSQVKEPDWEFTDCVLMPDRASNRIGAVLFWDEQEQTSSVAFFDEDGFFQQCGTSAKMPSDPDFTYLGEGAVTWKLEDDDHTLYHITLTISIEGDHVLFRAEDDRPQTAD